MRLKDHVALLVKDPEGSLIIDPWSRAVYPWDLARDYLYDFICDTLLLGEGDSIIHVPVVEKIQENPNIHPFIELSEQQCLEQLKAKNPSFNLSLQDLTSDRNDLGLYEKIKQYYTSTLDEIAKNVTDALS